MTLQKSVVIEIKDAVDYVHNLDNHKLILGKTIANVLPEITKDGEIDFLILDTIHYLLGELLDFIVTLPYLSEQATVILDDLVFAHIGENTAAIATRVLYGTVVADKILPGDGRTNIATFKLNADTRKYSFEECSNVEEIDGETGGGGMI